MPLAWPMPCQQSTTDKRLRCLHTDKKAVLGRNHYCSPWQRAYVNNLAKPIVHLQKTEYTFKRLFWCLKLSTEPCNLGKGPKDGHILVFYFYKKKKKKKKIENLTSKGMPQNYQSWGHNLSTEEFITVCQFANPNASNNLYLIWNSYFH